MRFKHKIHNYTELNRITNYFIVAIDGIINLFMRENEKYQ